MKNLLLSVEILGMPVFTFCFVCLIVLAFVIYTIVFVSRTKKSKKLLASKELKENPTKSCGCQCQVEEVITKKFEEESTEIISDCKCENPECKCDEKCVDCKCEKSPEATQAAAGENNINSTDENVIKDEGIMSYLETKSRDELLKICKDIGIVGVSRLKKAEIIERIKNN